MKVTPIYPDFIDEVWPQVKGYVQMCLNTSIKHDAVGDEIFNVEQTKEHIEKGNGLLLVVHDNIKTYGALVVEVLNTDAGRSLNLTSFGAYNLRNWSMLLLQRLKEVAETYNCDEISIFQVRPGWKRVLKPYGFKEVGMREYAGTMYPKLSLLIKENK